MGTLQFSLPPNLNSYAWKELRRASIAGGQDNMPYLTRLALQLDQLAATRQEDESGCLEVPWVVEPAGTLMTSTGTLIERSSPYSLIVELARGKVNQLRNQTADWQSRGFSLQAPLADAIRTATRSLGQAILSAPESVGTESVRHAQTALLQAYAAGDELAHAFADQFLQGKQQRSSRLSTQFGCRLGTTIPAELVSDAVHQAFNTVSVPLTLASVQPTSEKDFQWAAHDQLLDWALAKGFQVRGGPLVDFELASLPSAWLKVRAKYVAAIANGLCDYVEAAVRRYRERIHTWLLATASNCNHVLGLSEEEMLWLTMRIAEAARQADPKAELVIGVGQPWGEYLATQPRSHSPFAFADTLIRSGLNVTGLSLEMVMGVWPRGSYCRDLLEAWRLLDLYAKLGVPLHITLGLPSAPGNDPQANADYGVDAGSWSEGFTPEAQADWAEDFTRLALCVPAVQSLLWTHLSDAEPHAFPNCGLVDAQGNVKPALTRLGQLRAAYLQ